MSKIIAVLLALALATLANVANAATWEHFNADPAYPSREAAIADAPRVMRQAGYPEPVIVLLTEATKKPGVRTHVTNGMKLDFMRSGKSALWRNVEVKFRKPPRETSMEYSAPAEEWTVNLSGTVWTFGLPDVCNNSYGKRVSAPTPPPKQTLKPVATPAPTTACPKGYEITAHAWDINSMQPDLQQKVEAMIAAAKKRDSQQGRRLDVYATDAFSRTLGKQLRTEVKAQASITADLQIRQLDSTGQVVRDLGVLKMVNGKGTFNFPDDPRQYIVETIWPATFKSPVASGGAQRLRVFQTEWADWCSLNIHGVVL